jgi:hypothetical protein
MTTIEWNHPALPYSQQHFGYYPLVRELFYATERLNFLYPSTDRRTNGLPANDIKLLMKLYWDYRDSYNPTGRLSDALEKKMTKKYPPHSDEQSPSFDAQVANGVPRSPMKDLYATGDLNLTNPSTIRCFPLNRWLNGDHLWKNDFLTLLQCIHSTRNNRDDQERFQILIDFLHYNSKKRSIDPFYLTLLKTIVNDRTISFESIPFPPFRAYKSIEQVQVHRESLPHSRCGVTEEQRQNVYAEIDDCFQKNHPYTDEKNFFQPSSLRAEQLSNQRAPSIVASQSRTSNISSTLPNTDRFHFVFPYFPPTAHRSTRNPS